MIVWIAERVFPFEGREVLAVCASEKLARELVTADVDDDGDPVAEQYVVDSHMVRTNY